MPSQAAQHQERLPSGIELLAKADVLSSQVLTAPALEFLAALHRRFEPERRRRLAARREVQRQLDAGWRPDFRADTAALRAAPWRVAPPPADLTRRRVEITGPVERKMIINALNSGADAFMADFEDSNSPTWRNVLDGQRNLCDAVRRTIEFVQPASGKRYVLEPLTATLLVRPRGWHLEEAHLRVDGQPISASLFDFGLFFFHNARELVARGSGPYFYLPKLESALEARLWNEVFVFAQEALGLPRGTVRATVLIETILAAFELDEILYELREHSSGLNCGRWDYIFSFIKKFALDPGALLPERWRVTMGEHFLRSYSELVVRTCHHRGAHAIGGMSAFIPVKHDAARNEAAFAQVAADKRREALSGHDGAWVAHPGLVALVREQFEAVLQGRPHQIERLRDDVVVSAADLLRAPTGPITERGLRDNVRIGVEYLGAWLAGVGCVPLNDLMEDAATAEISRAQVWQWLRHGARLDDGRVVDRALVEGILAQECEPLRARLVAAKTDPVHHERARALFAQITLDPRFEEFLTSAAYRTLLFQGELDMQPIDPHPHLSATLDLEPLQQRLGLAWGVPSADPRRFEGIKRDYAWADVERLRGSIVVEHTLARLGAERLWKLLHEREFVNALGALTGNQAMQMVKAGLSAIYLSGWQVAADANLAGHMYPDQSLYPSNSVPMVVRRINQTLQRADQIAHLEGDASTYWMAPIVADAEAGFGGPLNAFELMKLMIEAGAAGVHFEDQLASEKKCGHLGGKVLIPTGAFIRTLNAARLAADICNVPTLLVARTDADAANLLTSDADERDRPFLTGERTGEGFFRVRSGIEAAIARGRAYAPYADLVWCETSHPDLGEARRFAEALHAEHPGKLLAYNCSPSFNWRKKLDSHTIAVFQRELGAMGYKFQFVTLAGFHALNHSMFELARKYKDGGMAAYSELQQAEFDSEALGYSATRHQREVGTGYFDAVSQAVARGQSSTTALEGSTEAEQFH